MGSMKGGGRPGTPRGPTPRPPEKGHPLPAPKAGPAELALMPPPVAPEEYLSATQWGMVAYLISDVALFGTLIMAYVALMGRDPAGSPTPPQVLSLPLAIVTTICLL